MMAVAGGATTAYRIEYTRGALSFERTTYPRAMCAAPDDAVTTVKAGGTATVAGGDMGAFHTAWAAATALPSWAQDT